MPVNICSFILLSFFLLFPVGHENFVWKLTGPFILKSQNLISIKRKFVLIFQMWTLNVRNGCSATQKNTPSHFFKMNFWTVHNIPRDKIHVLSFGANLCWRKREKSSLSIQMYHYSAQRQPTAIIPTTKTFSDSYTNKMPDIKSNH